MARNQNEIILATAPLSLSTIVKINEGKGYI